MVLKESSKQESLMVLKVSLYRRPQISSREESLAASKSPQKVLYRFSRSPLFLQIWVNHFVGMH